MSIKVLKSARVQAERISNGSKELINIAIIDGDNTIYHSFDGKTEVFKAMNSFDDYEMKRKFDYGHYCVMDGVLISFRYSDYNGFIHSDDSVKILADVLGVDASGKTNSSRLVDSPIFLGGADESFGVNVRGLEAGGEFDAKIVYTWSPFSDRISCGTEIIRLVCDNGMVSSSRFLTREVRIINDWQRNLSIVSTQLRPIISNFIQDRFTEMTRERATLSDTNSASSVLESRLSSTKDVEEQMRLQRLCSIVDVRSRLGGVYKDAGTSRTSAVVTDLTRYDVVNVLTEAFRYSEGNTRNNLSIQGAINKMVTNRNKVITNNNNVSDYQDGDHSRVFFGVD